MKIKKSLDKALEKVLIFIMSILVVDVLWQVLSRYILAAPSSFTDELAGFLLIWVGLLGAAYVAGQKQHLAIDLLLQKSSPANQKHLVRFINVCIALFALSVMIIGGSWLVITRFQFGVNSAALQYSPVNKNKYTVVKPSSRNMRTKSSNYATIMSKSSKRI